MTITTRDLFEMASLDVLGLLDEDERREFDRAFRAAPASLQAQIRREQLRMTEINDWLPDEDAPPGLKSRVVDAVRDAISAMRAGQGREHVVRKIGPFAVALQRNVNPLWRAASVGLMAATLVLAFSVMRVVQYNQTIASTEASDRAIIAWNDADIIDDVTDPEVRRVNFVPGDAALADSRVEAAIYINESTGSAKLACKNLASVEGGYKLVRVAANGKFETVSRFEPKGGYFTVKIENFVAQAGMELAILPETATSLSAAILVAGRA